MATIYDQVKAGLDRLLKSWQAKRLDGKVTLSEFFEFSREAVREAMTVVQPLADGPTKKALVLGFAGQLFDFFAPLIKTRFPWLGWLSWIFGEDLRDEFLALVGLLVEVIYRDEFKQPT